MSSSTGASGLGATLRLLVAVGAGIGGWFGYEQLVVNAPTALTTEASIAAATAVTTPWPDDLAIPDATWDAYTTTIQVNGDAIRRRIGVDASGDAALTEFTSAGEIESEAEIDASEVWYRSDGEWAQPGPDDDVSAAKLRSDAYQAPPPSITDLVGPEVWPFTELSSDESAQGVTTATRVLTVQIDVDGFVATDPSLATQWRQNSWLGDVAGSQELAIAIDADGHVVKLEQRTPDGVTFFRFTRLVEPISFSSPIEA